MQPDVFVEIAGVSERSETELALQWFVSSVGPAKGDIILYLNHGMEHILSEANSRWLVKEIPSFCCNGTFIVMFTRACYQSIFCANGTQSIFSYFFLLNLPSTPEFYKWSLPFRFSGQLCIFLITACPVNLILVSITLIRFFLLIKGPVHSKLNCAV